MFRFIHSSDLHLGRRFGNLPESIRGRLIEARHNAIGRLADAARQHGASHVLLSGDSFDTETPAASVWRQALAAMRSAADVQWWLIPGNHDSLAAEALWERLSERAPTNVHALRTDDPFALASGVTLMRSKLSERCSVRSPGSTSAQSEAAFPGSIFRRSSRFSATSWC